MYTEKALAEWAIQVWRRLFLQVVVTVAIVVALVMGIVAFAQADMQCNCGPNTQTTGAPQNPTTQGIHPR
jgi:hypothetical protein